MKIKISQILNQYLKYILRQKWMAITTLLVVVSVTVVDRFNVIVFGGFIDRVAAYSGEMGDLNGIYYQLILFIVLGVFVAAMWKTVGFLLSKVELSVISEMTRDAFSYTSRHSYDFFTDNFAGSIAKKINRMCRNAEGVIDGFVLEFVPIIVGTTMTFIYLAQINLLVAALVLVMVMAILGMHTVLSRKKFMLDREAARHDTMQAGQVIDSLSNNMSVKLFAGNDFEDVEFAKVVEGWKKAQKKAWFFGAMSDIYVDTPIVLMRFVVLLVSVWLWLHGLVKPSFFVILQLYVFQIWQQIFFFGRTLRRFYMFMADGEEMMQIWNMDHQVKDKRGAKELIISRGEIEFVNVMFKYKTGNETVLNKLSFRVRPGQKVALVGPSGGGKSTIVKLLMRLYDVAKGQILIDKQNIAKVTQDSLHQGISFVPQEPLLFHRTLMENIRYGRRDATDEEVIAASKMACVDDFVQLFPEKYETFVGERGVKLSGGQRQRVAIARAILSNAKILILDEATSSLDSESEQLIQRALNNLVKQKTVLVIAHRLSTIMQSDRIFVIENGRLKEDGSHADLINKIGGLYGRMWNIQVGEFQAR